MNPKEEQVPLRELVREGNEKINTILTEIAVIKTQGASYRDFIISHDQDIEKLKEDSNKQKGQQKAIGFISIVLSIVAGIKAFFGS